MLALALCVAACSRQENTQHTAAAITAFKSDDEAWRRERLEALQQPDGWTSLIGLHWIQLKMHQVGSAPQNGIRLAMGPPRLGILTEEGARIFLEPEKEVALTLNGQPMQQRERLYSDHDEIPSVVGFDDGKGQISVIKRGGRYALRVKHADAPSRLHFTGLDYWPADMSWRIPGRLIPHLAGKTLPIVDIIGTTSEMPNPGTLEFERDGKQYRLEAVGEPDGGLFVIFADRTSGQGSYPAGRFMDVPAADDQGKVLLDFNHAYNPPCAFTPFATCPLPPPENRLDLAVQAGEKKYEKPNLGSGH